jgi:hypothetical protein
VVSVSACRNRIQMCARLGLRLNRSWTFSFLCERHYVTNTSLYRPLQRVDKASLGCTVLPAVELDSCAAAE